MAANGNGNNGGSDPIADLTGRISGIKGGASSDVSSFNPKARNGYTKPITKADISMSSSAIKNVIVVNPDDVADQLEVCLGEGEEKVRGSGSGKGGVIVYAKNQAQYHALHAKLLTLNYEVITTSTTFPGLNLGPPSDPDTVSIVIIRGVNAPQPGASGQVSVLLLMEDEMALSDVKAANPTYIITFEEISSLNNKPTSTFTQAETATFIGYADLTLNVICTVQSGTITEEDEDHYLSMVHEEATKLL